MRSNVLLINILRQFVQKSCRQNSDYHKHIYIYHIDIFIFVDFLLLGCLIQHATRSHTHCWCLTRCNIVQKTHSVFLGS